MQLKSFSGGFPNLSLKLAAICLACSLLIPQGDIARLCELWVDDFEDFAAMSKSKGFLVFSHSKAFKAGHLSKCILFGRSTVGLQSVLPTLPPKLPHVHKKIHFRIVFALAVVRSKRTSAHKTYYSTPKNYRTKWRNVITYLPEKLPERYIRTKSFRTKSFNEKLPQVPYSFWAAVHLPGHSYEVSGNCDGGLHPLVGKWQNLADFQCPAGDAQEIRDTNVRTRTLTHPFGACPDGRCKT